METIENGIWIGDHFSRIGGTFREFILICSLHSPHFILTLSHDLTPTIHQSRGCTRRNDGHPIPGTR